MVTVLVALGGSLLVLGHPSSGAAPGYGASMAGRSTEVVPVLPVSGPPRPDSAITGAQPAPLGIADLGRGPAGAQGATFNTTTFRGTVEVGSASTYNASLGGSEFSMSFQLNAFLVFDLGGVRFAYWVQDVALFDTGSRTIYFEDNIWNVTNVAIDASAVSGNGTVVGSGNDSYYGEGAPCYYAGACSTLADPGTVTLELRAALGPDDVPLVRFLYADGGSLVSFDQVSFPFARSVTEYLGFFVAPGLGLPATCPRCFGDVELVAGGPGSGWHTALDGATDLTFSLLWWNGGNFEAVPDADNYGEATAEELSGATVAETSNAAGEPTATITNGAASSLGLVWSPPTSATLEVSVATGARSGNLSLNGATVPFVGTFVEVVEVPGAVTASVTSGGESYGLGAISLKAGEALTLEVGGEPLEFHPIGLPNGTFWSVTVGATTLKGTGNLTFGEVAGQYPYTVGALSGYRADPSSGNVTISAGSTTVAIRWSATGSSLAAELWSDLVNWAPLLVVLAILVAVAVVLATRRGRRPPT